MTTTIADLLAAPDEKALDLGNVSDTFVTRLARIERIGCVVRLVWAVRQRDVESTEDVVIARLVVPADQLEAIAEAFTIAAEDHRHRQAFDKRPPRLVAVN